jgi:hypothetical protein
MKLLLVNMKMKLITERHIKIIDKSIKRSPILTTIIKVFLEKKMKRVLGIWMNMLI